MNTADFWFLVVLGVIMVLFILGVGITIGFAIGKRIRKYVN